MVRPLIVAYASWRCRANRLAADKWLGHLELHARHGLCEAYVFCLEREQYYRQLSRMWEATALRYA
jgi:hypothetical protein